MAPLFKLPRSVYYNESIERQIAMDTPEHVATPIEISGWRITSVDYRPGGIFTHIEGADYPQKGYVEPETIWAINIVKKNIIEVVKVITIPEIFPAFIAFLCVPFKRKVKVIERLLMSYNRISFGVISSFILRPEYRMPFTKELEILVFNFLLAVGVNKPVSARFALIFANIIEYDNAYRLRILDILNETSKEALLAGPRQEVSRIGSIFIDRDIDTALKGRLKKIFMLASMVLWLPKVKKAVRAAVSTANFDMFKLDDIDKYWMCHRQDYYFMGLSYEDRKQLLTDAGLSLVEGKHYKV